MRGAGTVTPIGLFWTPAPSPSPSLFSTHRVWLLWPAGGQAGLSISLCLQSIPSHMLCALTCFLRGSTRVLNTPASVQLFLFNRSFLAPFSAAYVKLVSLASCFFFIQTNTDFKPAYLVPKSLMEAWPLQPSDVFPLCFYLLFSHFLLLAVLLDCLYIIVLLYFHSSSKHYRNWNMPLLSSAYACLYTEACTHAWGG